MNAGSIAAEPPTEAIGPGRVVFDQSAIRDRIGQLGAAINRDYAGRELTVVGILKGAAPFLCDLVREIAIPTRLDFISITSYSPPPQGGVVRMLKDLEEDISDRDVLVVEDIVDTGLTLNYLRNLMLARRPRSLEICSLLDRPELRLAAIPIRYVGFEVNAEFLVGYGLDYREQYRNLPYIATMKGTGPDLQLGGKEAS